MRVVVVSAGGKGGGRLLVGGGKGRGRREGGAWVVVDEAALWVVFGLVGLFGAGSETGSKTGQREASSCRKGRYDCYPKVLSEPSVCAELLTNAAVIGAPLLL